MGVGSVAYRRAGRWGGCRRLPIRPARWSFGGRFRKAPVSDSLATGSWGCRSRPVTCWRCGGSRPRRSGPGNLDLASQPGGSTGILTGPARRARMCPVLLHSRHRDARGRHRSRVDRAELAPVDGARGRLRVVDRPPGDQGDQGAQRRRRDPPEPHVDGATGAVAARQCRWYGAERRTRSDRRTAGVSRGPARRSRPWRRSWRYAGRGCRA